MPTEARRVRVLVVEDHQDTLMVMRRLMELFGYECETAATGNDAIALAEAEPIDVVLCDLELPDLGGREVIERIQRVRPVRVVAITGHAEPSARRASVDSGLADHLVKPLDVDQLQRVLRALMNDE